MTDTGRNERFLVVTGASGYVGRHLLDEARLQGWQVIALSRRPPHREDVLHVPYELCRPLPEWPSKPVRGVVHLAYDASGVTVSPEREVAAAEELAVWAHQRGVPLFFLSSQNAGIPTRYGRVKERIEDLVLRYGGTVVRVGLIYGGYLAGSGLFWQLDEWVRRFPVIPFFIPAPRVVPIHVRDLSRWLLQAVETPGYRGRRLFLYGGIECSLNYFLWHLCRYRHRTWRLPVPVPLTGVRGLTRLLIRAFPRLSWVAQRIDGLIELRPVMATGVEVLQVPGRSPANGLYPAGSGRRRQWLREGHRILRRLLGRRAPGLLVRHYARACEAAEIGGGRSLSRRERTLLAIALVECSPWAPAQQVYPRSFWSRLSRGARLMFWGTVAFLGYLGSRFRAYPPTISR